jgi:Arc/MetJ family transcription regulator
MAMRTSVFIDDELMRQAMEISGIKTKRELVNQAIKEFVENHKRLNLLDLVGEIKFAEGYDYKAARKDRQW